MLRTVRVKLSLAKVGSLNFIAAAKEEKRYKEFLGYV